MVLLSIYLQSHHATSAVVFQYMFHDKMGTTLQWRHNGRDGVSNHQPHDCLLNRIFRRSSKKTSKLRDTGLCAGNSPMTGEFPAQMASNAENVSIWWRHQEINALYRSVPRDTGDIQNKGPSVCKLKLEPGAGIRWFINEFSGPYCNLFVHAWHQ